VRISEGKIHSNPCFQGFEWLTILGMKLTKRESDVLAAFAHGLSYEEIGKQLFISARTVNGHLCRVRSKTSTTTRAGLVAFAIKCNLLDPH